MKVDINKNWSNLIGIIHTHISEPRKTKLLNLYNEYEERIKTMPASVKINYHSCYEGGYVQHVLNVCEASLKLAEVWKDLGTVINWTQEELIFSALNHDLGKIGDGDQVYYMPNPSDWHIKNQGALYIVNENLPFMSIHDRSLYLLQKYDIKCTYNETLAIRLHGGLYDDGTKDYLVGYNKPVTSLPYILHQADLASARIEYEKRERQISQPKITKVFRKNQQLSESNGDFADRLKNII
jgi:HD superfamily phosphohydrolase YqeK